MSKRFHLLFVAVLLLSVSGFLTGQANLTTGTVLNAWLEAFNSGNASDLLAFWKQYGSGDIQSAASNDSQLRAMTGGFTLVTVVEDTGSHLVVALRDSHSGFAEITMDFSSTQPLLLKSISGHPTPPPPPDRDPSADDQQLATRVRAHAEELLAKDQFSGAILIAHGQRPIVELADGLADRAKHIKNSMDTQFCIGSMNKMFTAVAVLQLVQLGKLSLDSKVADYWPSYPNKDLAGRVTIRQLLNHTGGTGDIFTHEYETHRLEIKTLGDYVKLFGNRAPAFEPGSRFEYSNYGFILLGRLIEIVSGEDYQAYIQQHIYTPAGMLHTDSLPTASLDQSRAIGYVEAAGKLQPNTSTQPFSGTSAGGGYSTAGDLLRFANALTSGKLLDSKLFHQAITDQTHTGYGLGFNCSKDGVFGHGGGAPGVNAEMRVFPSGYTVIVLENLDPPSATAMKNYIAANLPLA